MNGILESGHSLVVDYSLWAKYQSQLSGLPGAFPGFPHILRSLNGAYSARKLDILPNAPPFPEETSIPQGSQDDVTIVRLAVASGAILVTTDNPLIADLKTAGITDQYQLQVVTPAQAIDLL